MSIRTGDQLRAGRTLTGKSQIELAAALGLNVNTMRPMEGREAEPIRSSGETLAKAADALKRYGVRFHASFGEIGVLYTPLVREELGA